MISSGICLSSHFAFLFFGKQIYTVWSIEKSCKIPAPWLDFHASVHPWMHSSLACCMSLFSSTPEKLIISLFLFSHLSKHIEFNNICCFSLGELLSTSLVWVTNLWNRSIYSYVFLFLWIVMFIKEYVIKVKVSMLSPCRSWYIQLTFKSCSETKWPSVVQRILEASTHNGFLSTILESPPKWENQEQ